MIDGRGHLVGRLASIVAKNLLNGKRIVVVRCEELEISGDIYRSQRKAMQFRRKRQVTNPKKGPFHQRAPSGAFYRAVRGMLPHKLPRGQAALANLKVFDGVPDVYAKVKKLVVPDALRALRLAPGHRSAKLGAIQQRVGWTYAPVVKKLEAARKTAAYAWYLKRKVDASAKAKATVAANKDAKLKPFSALLQATGYN